MSIELNDDQKAALEVLNGHDNVFVTGAAGSGKSFLMKTYLKGKSTPVLASTGAAAIIIGGRTFHSFFGLGIMEGGVDATVERALKNKKLVKRLKSTDCVVIDEISMISGPTLRAAEAITRRCRGEEVPWGGMRIIVVGDFAQLPPVNPYSRQKEWAFLDEVWEKSCFKSVTLNKIMRTTDLEFLEVLNNVRDGKISERTKSFLDSRIHPNPEGELTRLFAHRQDVERYNNEKLNQIDGPITSFKTTYVGKERDIDNFRKNSPIADVIQIKKDALVMLRQNDPEGRWVNGSLGFIENISSEVLKIRLLTGIKISLAQADFTLLDAEGLPVVTATNFPISLAWAMTIHKAQGATLDRMLVDLRKVWEPGQAYVALSRARDPEGLFIEGWNAKSIFSDAEVTRFHSELPETSP